MSSLLLAAYPWVKALHVVSVIAWMAALLYLPRLFIYHVQVAPFSEAAERYKAQARRLHKAIMSPAMMAAWLFGLMLVFTPGVVGWNEAWPWLKAAFVLVLTFMHHLFGRWRRALVRERRRPSRDYRIANEVPTLAMLVIVAMVIVRPF